MILVIIHSQQTTVRACSCSVERQIYILIRGEGAAVASGPTDHWMTRFTGYFTAPVSGNYQFGTGGDDGTRIFLNGSTTAYRSDWSDRGWTMAYGGDVYLGRWSNHTNDNRILREWRRSSIWSYVRGAVAEQVIPSTWLSTKINPLPGWMANERRCRR